jgi:amino acid permease
VTPVGARRGGAARPGMAVLLHGAAWPGLAGSLFVAVPRIESGFHDYGVDLPRLTLGVIAASHFVIRWPLVLPMLLVADLVVLSIFEAAARRRAWSVLIFTVPVGLFVLMIVALALPFFNMDFGLSG